jgi:PAS domain S-box-containing protein
VSNVKSGRIIEVNESYCSMVGYTREELLNLRTSDLVFYDSTAEVVAHTRKIFELGYDRFETCHRHKQGQPVIVEINASHSDMNAEIIYAFVRDLSEIRKNEALHRTLI